MKKYIIIVLSIIAFCLFADAAYYRLGWYIDVRPNAEASAVAKTEENAICILDESGE